MPSEPEAAVRWLRDIHYHIVKAEAVVTGISHEAFLDDDLRFYAVTRCLEIISEASRSPPEDIKARHPSIQWSEMAAADNIYRHGYDNVAADRVWYTLTQSLPSLRVTVMSELASLELFLSE